MYIEYYASIFTAHNDPVVTFDCRYRIVLRRSWWRQNCLRSGAGIIYIIIIYCSQFGGCWDKGKLISTSIGTVLQYYYCLLKNSIKWQYIARAGAGAKIRDKETAGAENK